MGEAQQGLRDVRGSKDGKIEYTKNAMATKWTTIGDRCT
jgi:hypothetical protein